MKAVGDTGMAQYRGDQPTIKDRGGGPAVTPPQSHNAIGGFQYTRRSTFTSKLISAQGQQLTGFQCQRTGSLQTMGMCTHL